MLSFQSLADALKEPGEFLLTDFAKLERSPLLHIGFQALDAFTVRPLESTFQATLPIPLLPTQMVCAMEVLISLGLTG